MSKSIDANEELVRYADYVKGLEKLEDIFELLRKSLVKELKTTLHLSTSVVKFALGKLANENCDLALLYTYEGGKDDGLNEDIALNEPVENKKEVKLFDILREKHNELKDSIASLDEQLIKEIQEAVLKANIKTVANTEIGEKTTPDESVQAPVESAPNKEEAAPVENTPVTNKETQTGGETSQDQNTPTTETQNQTGAETATHTENDVSSGNQASTVTNTPATGDLSVINNEVQPLGEGNTHTTESV